MSDTATTPDDAIDTKVQPTIPASEVDVVEFSTADEMRQAIFEIDDIQEEMLVVPEWGNLGLLIRGMTGTQRASFMEQYRLDDGKGGINWQGMYPFLIIQCGYHPSTRERVFRPEDSNAINAKSGAALERVARVAMRLSGMGEDEEKAAGNDS